MTLRDNKFETTYDTNFDGDVVDDFYIRALSSSREYKRMSGFFSSSSLAVAAEGIVELIKNDGTMKLLTSPYLDREDVEMLKKLDEDPDSFNEYISDKLSDFLDLNGPIEDHVEALGWMIANNRLEIRIVLVKNENGDLLTAEEIDSSGLFHNKVGILTDGINTVAFSGSINETYSGWKKNIESFHVFCDWEEGMSRYIDPLRLRFDKYWELGSSNRSVTIEFPQALKEKWIKSVPAEKGMLSACYNKMVKTKLRKYQNEAIDNWFANKNCGLFNMATATGKTVTAVYAIKRLFEREKKMAVVVTVPFQHLVEEPWVKTIKKELTSEYFTPNFVLAFDSSKKWIPEAKEAIENLNYDVVDNVVIITTYDSFSTEKFKDLMSSIRCKKLLVADEVHNSGAETYRLGLLEQYNFRLGLSATPARYLDDDGTNFIQNYFCKEVYSFSLERAINEINPDTGQTYLTPYYYRPVFASLNEEELGEYRSLTARLLKYQKVDELTPSELKARNMLLIMRARIVKNAANKTEVLDSLIPELKKEGRMDYCLIYCSDGKDPDEEKTITKVIKCLNKYDISNRRFTSDDKIKDRSVILDSFKSGETKTIVAIKCLDEGVDVPAIRNAIIMASTGNPREYIQRRGRVLRRFEGKENATIYDFIIVPSDQHLDLRTESQIFYSEYERFKEFSSHSINTNENNALIEKVAAKHSLRLT